MTINDFIKARSDETYPEPASIGHTSIIEQVCPLVSEKLKSGAMILDVGCGQGAALEWFTEKGFKAFGITPNEEDLQECGRRQLWSRRVDMHSMDFGNQSFDCVFARHVLEHSPIPFYVLHEFYRILKPGGVLYVEVPSPDTECRHEANPNHYSVMGFKMWANLIHRAGFGPIEFRELPLVTEAGTDKYFFFLTSKP